MEHFYFPADDQIIQEVLEAYNFPGTLPALGCPTYDAGMWYSVSDRLSGWR